MCVCVCVCACMWVMCVHACVCACVRACVWQVLLDVDVSHRCRNVHKTGFTLNEHRDLYMKSSHILFERM